MRKTLFILIVALLIAQPVTADGNKKMASGKLLDGDMAHLGAASWYNWQWYNDDANFVPMARANGWEPYRARCYATANPGRTWLIGNEPTMEDQDGFTANPRAAGRWAGNAIKTILAGDPTARFIIGGFMLHNVSHEMYPNCGYDGSNWSSGLGYWSVYYAALKSRLEPWQLERVIGWHIHVYYRSYDAAKVYRVERFVELVETFRRWQVAQAGGGELWITEFGVLQYRPAPGVVQYMRQCMDWMDGTEYIARYSWYLGRADKRSIERYAGYVLIWPSGKLTPLGEEYRR